MNLCVFVLYDRLIQTNQLIVLKLWKIVEYPPVNYNNVQRVTASDKYLKFS